MAFIITVSQKGHCSCYAEDMFRGPDLEEPGKIVQCAVDGGPVYRVKLDIGKNFSVVVEFLC